MPRLTAVTLGVKDLRASTAFYEALGFVRKFRSTGDEITFLDGGGVVIALWSWSKLAEDACLVAEPSPGLFRGTTLAWNCATAAEVDIAFDKALAIGAKPLRHPEKADYGGYRGYFSDPDGHVWEVVQAPGLALTPDGRIVLPE